VLPAESDFLAIVIDSLDGDDVITVGPTVTKSVWVDAGSGDDVINIQEGEPILPDQAEGETGNGNEVAADSFSLPAPVVIELETTSLQLTEDATFDLMVNGLSAPVTITIPASLTDANESLDDLVDDINSVFLEQSVDGSVASVLSDLVIARRLGSGADSSIALITVEVSHEATLAIANANDAAKSLLGAIDDELGVEGTPAITLSRSLNYTGLTIDSPTDVDWYNFQLASGTELKPGDAIQLTSVSLNDNVALELHRYDETSRTFNLITQSTDGRIELDGSGIDAGEQYFIKVSTDRIPTVYQIEFVTGDFLEGASGNDSVDQATEIEQIHSIPTAMLTISNSISLLNLLPPMAQKMALHLEHQTTGLS